MTEAIDPIAWLIVLALAWPLAAFVLGPDRGARLAIAALTLQWLLAAALADRVLAHGPQRLAVGGWGAPLGIDLLADGLSAAMLLLTATVALPIAAYARAWFAARPEGRTWFWPLAGLLVAALNVLFLSNDLFNLYVGLELLGLAAVSLTAGSADRAALAAALRYLFATLLGSGAWLMGVALLYGTYGTVSLERLAPHIAPLPAVVLAAALMVAGMLLKTALFPLHFWLPPAHGGAPAPVSALLSALVLKASFYLVLRLWPVLLEPLGGIAAAQLAGMLGAGAILWGSAMALVQQRLKMLVAYSTVAQVGYLFLFFPLAAGAAPEVAANAFRGVALYAVAHALAKAAMFAAAGAMVLAAGRDEVASLGGVAPRLPLALFAFGLAGMTLIGLPPSIGFSAKWLLLAAAVDGGRWGWAALIVVGGLLTAAYVFRVLRQAFLPPTPGVPADAAPPAPVARTLELAALALALLAVALGFFGTLPSALLAVGEPWTGPLRP